MNWASLRDRVREWGPMAFCALLSLSAFYLLILQGGSPSKMVLLGVILVCPVVYFVAWLLGDNPRNGWSGRSIRPELDTVLRERTWHRPALRTPRVRPQRREFA